jgi:hypothetical protein
VQQHAGSLDLQLVLAKLVFAVPQNKTASDWGLTPAE